jgi:hypothetical protein
MGQRFFPYLNSRQVADFLRYYNHQALSTEEGRMTRVITTECKKYLF